MATATKEIQTIEKVVLTLSKEEAQALAVVCSLVGGDPETSRRKLIDQIQSALKSVDIFFIKDTQRNIDKPWGYKDVKESSVILFKEEEGKD